jgi:diguanylate cyclase
MLLPDSVVGRPARLGTWLVGVCTTVIAISVWAVARESDLVRLYLVVVGTAGAGLALRIPPEHRLQGNRRLLFPGLILAELCVFGVMTPATAQPYLPLNTLAFIYVGLVCPPRGSYWLIPPAAVSWLLANGVPDQGIHAATVIRLPITVAVWLLIGELLARYVTQVRVHTDLLENQAHTDALTGLSNRRVLPELLATVRPGDALVMLDVDHFRLINERRGHGGGDEVLRALGTVVRSCSRTEDRAVRYGGEEILLLLPGVADAAGITSALSRMSTAWSALQPGVTFSLGGVVVSPGQAVDDALRSADQLLYEAKQAGRNCWRLTDRGGESGSASVPPSAVAAVG